MSKILIIFILSFAYGIYAIIFIGPVYGFYLYELVYFLNPVHRWWSSGLPNISYSFVVVVLMLVSFLLRHKQYQGNKLSDMPEAKWFVMLFILYCLVYFVAVSPEMHRRFLFDYFKLLVIMYIAFRLIDNNKKLDLALLCYLIGAAYIGYEAFTVGRNSTGRVEGIGTIDAPDANGIATAIAPTISLLLYYAWQASLKKKLFIGLLTLLITNGLILINSRGAFLGGIVGASYFLFIMAFSKYKLPKQRIMVIIIVICGSLGSYRLIDKSFIERMSSIQSSSIKSSQSGAARVKFWLATFDMLEDYPMGVGIWGYQILSPLYLSQAEMEKARREGHKNRAVHSMWFQGLSEVGWLGFLLFFSLFLSIYRHSKKAKKYALINEDFKQYFLIISIEGALISFIVAGSFIDAFRAEILYWFMTFSICVSAITLHKYENIEDHTKK